MTTSTLDDFLQPSTFTPDSTVDPLKPVEVTPTAETTETVVEDTTDVPTVVADKVELPPDVAAKYADLDVYLKATVGAGLEEVVNTLRDLGTFRQEVVVDREAKVLMNEWSVDKSEYDRRMGLIVNEYKKLSPTEQAALDSTNGAKILWNNIELQQMKSGMNVQQPAVPKVVNSIRRGTQAYDFTQSQIMSMSRADYEKMSTAITVAYASGRVLKDVQMN